MDAVLRREEGRGAGPVRGEHRAPARHGLPAKRRTGFRGGREESCGVEMASDAWLLQTTVLLLPKHASAAGGSRGNYCIQLG